MTKQEKWNLEQQMVYLFKKISDSPTMRLGKNRKDYLWSAMCGWNNEYMAKVIEAEKIEVRSN